ncbi:hypothetical protein KLSP111695_29145 [Klebsiella spallanzanii]
MNEIITMTYITFRDEGNITNFNFILSIFMTVIPNFVTKLINRSKYISQTPRIVLKPIKFIFEFIQKLRFNTIDCFSNI